MSLHTEQELQQELTKVTAGRSLSFHDFITIEALTPEDQALIYDVGALFKRFVTESPRKKLSLLRGKSIINVFFEPSTRTRISFELGGKHLGADTINFSAKSSSNTKGETLGDTARTLAAMQADMLIVRNAGSGVPELIAREVETPIINAGDGWHEHPSQSLFDIFTMQEHFGELKDKQIAIIGDIRHSRVAGSLMRIAPKMGMKVIACGPETLLPDGIEQFGVEVAYHLDDIIGNIDVAYALRIQHERGAKHDVPSLREYSKCYGVNPTRAAKMKPHAIVMHPGPVMREVDVMTPVLESQRSKIETQVTNGFAVRMALMYLMIGTE